MKIYNTLTKAKEEFVPREGKKVKMFVCGPTVYDYIHIGNARTFVIFDAFAKYLRYRGYKLRYIQNITDIDDKIIKRAEEEGVPALELAKKYEKIFLEDMKALGVTAVTEYDKYARATEHIKEVVAQVLKLKEKGHAYLIENDGWYFDLSTFPQYGILSKRTMKMANDGVSRIDESVNKRNRGDFCLWKFSKPGEPSWPSEELGKGRPGWHIEDTAITEHYFGPQYDIHGAGQDLIFPHHEAEIAQQSSAAGIKPEEFVKYWMHTGFLVNKEEKMSKSLGNFMRLNESLKKYSPEVLRFYFLSAHYRSPLDYSEAIFKQSEAAVQRISEFKQRVSFYHGSEKPSHDQIDAFREIYDSTIEALEDDFDTPIALARLFETIKLANKYVELDLDIAEMSLLFDIIKIFDNVFGIVPKTSHKTPSDVANLVAEREKLRTDKDYSAGDQLRSQIESMGYQIDDTAYGPLVKKKS